MRASKVILEYLLATKRGTTQSPQKSVCFLRPRALTDLLRLDERVARRLARRSRRETVGVALAPAVRELLTTPRGGVEVEAWQRVGAGAGVLGLRASYKHAPTTVTDRSAHKTDFDKTKTAAELAQSNLCESLIFLSQVSFVADDHPEQSRKQGRSSNLTIKSLYVL